MFKLIFVGQMGGKEGDCLLQRAHFLQIIIQRKQNIPISNRVFQCRRFAMELDCGIDGAQQFSDAFKIWGHNQFGPSISLYFKLDMDSLSFNLIEMKSQYNFWTLKKQFSLYIFP
jgi:hypothetical protein